MRRPLAALLLLATPLAPIVSSAPAVAQGSASYNFLKAVRDRDGAKAIDLLGSGGSTLINTRDLDSGDTALHIVVARRDMIWINFMLQHGADANIANRAGETPLMAAAQLGFVEGIQALVAGGARVNGTNSRGETALHIAVQRRDITAVRALVAARASADIQDNVAGLSARDYAARDPRAVAILSVINESGAAQAMGQGPAVAGPH